MTRERFFGWAGSIVVHCAAAAGLTAWSVPQSGDGLAPEGMAGSGADGASVTVVSPSPSPETLTETTAAGRVPASGDRSSSSSAVTGSNSAESGPAAVSSTRREVVFWLEWEGGTERRRVWAAVPELGAATAPGTHVRVRASVRPDGTVAQVSSAAGGDEEFRESSLSIVRRWRFTPVSSRRLGDQTCTITFKVVPR